VSLVTGLAFVQLVVQFATQLVLANYFGSGDEMDAFVAALAPPVVIATILSGSLGYVLVPVFTERLTTAGERDATTVSGQVGLYLVAISAVITLIIAGAAEPLIGVLCPGFTSGKRELSAGLLQILSGLIIANSLIAFLNALFHCQRRFAPPAVAGVIGTLVTLGYVVALHPRQGIHAVAWGVLLGAMITVALLLPLFLSQLRQAFSPGWALHPGTRRALTLLTPLFLGAIYWRLDPLVDRFLGSYLSAGSLSHLGYAWRLTAALMMIGTSGLSVVAFPAIAGHVAAERQDALRGEIAYGMRFLLFLLVPVIAGLIGFHQPVVRLLFERGRFTGTDTQAVALLVVLYLGVVAGASFGDLLSRTLYALQDMRTPVVLSTIGFTLAAGLKFLIVAPTGAFGLAAATSFYFLFNAAALLAVLLRRLGFGIVAGSGGCLLRAIVSSAVACVAAEIVGRLQAPFAVLPAAIAGVATYFLTALALRDEFAIKLSRFLTATVFSRDGMTRLRLWLARLLVVTLTTIVALKVGDLTVGWLRNTQQRHLLRLPVNANFRHQSTEFDYTFNANSLGLRGPERPIAKPPGTRRVELIGDSFVAGYGVANDDVLTVKLERLLNADSKSPVEVINLGRTGSSTIRELDLYTLIGRRFQPDVVVLAYFLGNDLREVIEEHDQEELRQWHPQGTIRRAAYGLCPNIYLELALLKLSAEMRQSLAPQSEADILAILRRECESRGADYAAAEAAYQRLPEDVRRGLEQGRLRHQQIIPACYDPGRLRRSLDPPDDYFQKAWPRTERHLELLAAAVAKDHGQFILLIIPDSSQVNRAANEFTARLGYDVDSAWLTNSCRTADALHRWASSAGVPCLDLTDDFRLTATPLYFLQDGHFTPAGHERTAELLNDLLRRDAGEKTNPAASAPALPAKDNPGAKRPPDGPVP
jgi:putative peptidoglycan lipid II flippase